MSISAEAIEIDNFKTTGFKTNKTGFSVKLILNIWMICI